MSGRLAWQEMKAVWPVSLESGTVIDRLAGEDAISFEPTIRYAQERRVRVSKGVDIDF